MGRRENNERQGVVGQSLARGRPIRAFDGEPNQAMAPETKPDPSREAVQKAHEVLKDDYHHNQMVADGLMMLKSNQPFIHTVFERLSEELFVWFRHQGFWPAHWPKDLIESMQMFGPDSIDGVDDEQLRLKKMEKLGLIVTEIAEAMEAVRNGDAQNEREELCDTLVRLFDYIGGFGHANLIGEAFIGKMQKNYERPFKHGKQF